MSFQIQKVDTSDSGDIMLKSVQMRNCVCGRTIDRHPVPAGAKEELLEAYCLKCREKREMKEPKPITMKNGKPATEGTCPTCSTRMFKIGAAKA